MISFYDASILAVYVTFLALFHILELCLNMLLWHGAFQGVKGQRAFLGALDYPWAREYALQNWNGRSEAARKGSHGISLVNWNWMNQSIREQGSWCCA
jgi:hypothetical protein